jgi:hypothetical protein
MKIYPVAKAIFNIFRNFKVGGLKIAGIVSPYGYPFFASPKLCRSYASLTCAAATTAHSTAQRRTAFCIYPDVKKSYFLISFSRILHQKL